MSEAKSRSASRRSGRMTGSGGRGSGRPEQAFDEVNSRVRAAEALPRSAGAPESVGTLLKHLKPPTQAMPYWYYTGPWPVIQSVPSGRPNTDSANVRKSTEVNR